ncbi:HEAT repeat domain-containing protein [Archangium gephyra]|uniref:hypothetical protein n=1 Tax=Archangium gephyra TaxID=48 RepID=UPI0035D4ED2A
MPHKLDVEQWQSELVKALEYGEQERARALVAQPGPRKARTLLEAMLEDRDALVRQAAAFGLGELGGAASARCLEQQIAVEEARGGYDGDSVVEVITQALGRLQEADTRATLVRRLQRLVTRGAAPSDITTVVHALWRKRHPSLVPVVRKSLEQHPLPAPLSLQGLLLLLEKSPEELDAWVRDASVPVELKRGVVTVLEEEVPEAWKPTLPAFLSTAKALLGPAASEDGAEAYYCERLFILLLLNEKPVLTSLSREFRATLREVARGLVAAKSLSCAMRAVNLLDCVGLPEDASLIEAHRPEDPTLAAAFAEAAQALRYRQPSADGPRE